MSHADYYTGIVFKGYLSEVGQSVLKGGRYDRLLAEFGNDCPAVGFGISVDSVARHIEKLGGAPKLRTPERSCVRRKRVTWWKPWNMLRRS